MKEFFHWKLKEVRAKGKVPTAKELKEKVKASPQRKHKTQRVLKKKRNLEEYNLN